MVPSHKLRSFFVVPRPDDPRFAIRGVGVQETLSRYMVDRPAGFEAYLLMLFYDAVRIRFESGIVACPPYHMTIWQPGDPQWYGNLQCDWSHSWLLCCGSDVESTLSSLAIPVNSLIHVSDPEVFEDPLSSIHREVNRREPDAEILRALFAVTAREVSRAACGRNTDDSIPARMVAIRRYLDTSYGTRLTLASIAREFSISVPHLCAQYREHFGRSVIDYVIDLRLRHAIHLLHDRSLTVTQIARIVGYPDIFHFSRLFKRHYRLSPGAMRASFLTR